MARLFRDMVGPPVNYKCRFLTITILQARSYSRTFQYALIFRLHAN